MCTSANRCEAPSLLTKLRKSIFKPICRNTILFHYAPLLGIANYGLLSVNVINPSILGCYFPNRDVTNILLMHSVAGLGLQIYSRPHLDCVSNTYRILYSSYASILFNFGSVLIWAITGRLFPTCGANNTTTYIGLGTGLVLTMIGKAYLDHIDSPAAMR